MKFLSEYIDVTDEFHRKHGIITICALCSMAQLFYNGCLFKIDTRSKIQSKKPVFASIKLF